jgi:hypothetical protein
MTRTLDAAVLPAFVGLSEIWISFLLQRNSGPTLPHEGDLAVLSFGYPRVGPTPAYRLSIGEQTDADELSFSSGSSTAQVPAQPVNDASISLGIAEAKLIVFKLSLDVEGTSDFGQMFVNPIIGQSTPGVDPIAESAMSLQKWFTSVTLSSGGVGSEFIFDEFRMGSSYADVTPTVPEPSSLLLLATTGAAWIGSRRWREAA